MKIVSGRSSEKKSLLDLSSLELELSIPGACHFSLWLIPSRNDHNLLMKIIEDLANQYNAPVFEPHVTVYTGINTQEDELEEIVARFVEMVQPVSLIVKGIGYSDNFFKTLFIEFKDNPVLTTLAQRTSRELQYQEPYDLQPHLSLLYKKSLGKKEKQAIVDQLNFTKPQVHFDEVAVMSPGSLSQGWVDVEDWKLCFKQKLVTPVLETRRWPEY